MVLVHLYEIQNKSISEGLLRHIITFIKKCFHSAFTYVLLSTYSQLIQFFRLKRTLFFELAILKILKEIK